MITPMIKIVIAMPYKSQNISQSVPLHRKMVARKALPLPLI